MLFRSGELACAGDRFCKYLSHIDSIMQDSEYIAINPLRESRRDSHCTAYRNFLVEIDKGTLAQQKQYIQRLDMPFSTVTFSGNKSLHFIIALEEGVTREEYEEYAKRLLKAVKHADQTTKNPSRLTRLPGGVNQKTGREQKLLYVGYRVPRSLLDAFLDARVPRSTKVRHARVYSRLTASHGLSKRTQEFLQLGAPEGERNGRLYEAACDYALKGYPLSQAETELIPVLTSMYEDISEHECVATIHSAYTRFNSA